mgnify:CR=1 FL=1
MKDIWQEINKIVHLLNGKSISLKVNAYIADKIR